MISHRNIREHASRIREYSSIDSEVQFLSEKFNFSVDEVLAAIQEVGFDRDEIREYIRDRRDRM